MSEISAIQWTDATWNIARGCTKVDEDCKFCYMYRDSMDSTRYDPLQVVRTKTVFDMPIRYKNKVSACWDGPPLVFTSSLTDWGHDLIDSYRGEMWTTVRKRPDLIFQMLTKRIGRGNAILPEDWESGYKNVWLGTSIGSNKAMTRYRELIQLPAHRRFISFEPLHDRIDTRALTDSETRSIDWVIIGGESGHETGKYRYRPCEVAWIEEIAHHFLSHGVAVFIKQMGTHLAKQFGYKNRHGGDINEWPENLQIRQFPKP